MVEFLIGIARNLWKCIALSLAAKVESTGMHMVSTIEMARELTHGKTTQKVAGVKLTIRNHRVSLVGRAARGFYWIFWVNK